MFRINEFKRACAGMKIISENIWAGNKPLLTPVSFCKGTEITQLPALANRQCQCSVLFSTDGSNTSGQFFTRQSAGNISWFGLATLHSQLIQLYFPSQLKLWDPTKSLPCYFNHPLLFTLPVTLRLNLLFYVGQKGSHKGKDWLTGLSLLTIPVLAAAPSRHQCHLPAMPAGRWLSKQQFSQEDILASKIYSLLSCWQFPTTLI